VHQGVEGWGVEYDVADALVVENAATGDQPGADEAEGLHPRNDIDEHGDRRGIVAVGPKKGRDA
jgi:hypothetical protein